MWVKDYVEATIGSTTVLAGETTNTVPVDFFTSAPLLTLDYVLRFNGLRLTNLVIEPLAPGIANVSLLQSDANTASATATLSFVAMGGNTLQGTQRLARVRFTAVTNQISAFVPLDIDSMNVTMSPSLAPTLVATDGRIAVIGAQPLLDAHFTAAGARELGLYGRRNTTYLVQYSTNLANITNWIQRGNALAMGANLYRTVPVGNIPNTNLPAVFRARTQ